MRSDDLIEAVEGDAKGTYTRPEVLKLLRAASNIRDTIRVEHIRRGDVFWHHLVGGKVRPWLCLRVNDGLVTAVALSSGDKAPRMIQSEARNWPGAWIGTAVCLIEADTARMAVSRPYDNADHINQIEDRLEGLLALGGKRRRAKK